MVIPDRFIVLYRTQYYKLHMSVRFRLSVSRLFDRVSVSVDLVSVCDRVEIQGTVLRLSTVSYGT